MNDLTSNKLHFETVSDDDFIRGLRESGVNFGFEVPCSDVFELIEATEPVSNFAKEHRLTYLSPWYCKNEEFSNFVVVENGREEFYGANIRISIGEYLSASPHQGRFAVFTPVRKVVVSEEKWVYDI